MGGAGLFGRLASTPVQQFNQQIRQAGSRRAGSSTIAKWLAASWVMKTPTRIHAQQLDNDLVLSVALDGQKSDMLYILTLFRSNNLWQMRQAEMGWRCQARRPYPVPCP